MHHTVEVGLQDRVPRDGDNEGLTSMRMDIGRGLP